MKRQHALLALLLVPCLLAGTAGCGGKTPASSTDGSSAAPIISAPDDISGPSGTSDGSSAVQDPTASSGGTAARTTAGKTTKAAGTTATKANSTNVSGDTLTIRLADLDVAGDGKTDDGREIGSAIMEAVNYTYANPGKKAVVEFEKGKTYRISRTPVSVADVEACLVLREAKNVTLRGNGATIIGDPNKMYLSVTQSTDVTIEGLNFDYDMPVAVTATVTRQNDKTIDFETPIRLPFDGDTFSYDADQFALPANDGRDHSFFRTITRLSDKSYRITFSHGGYPLMKPGTKIYLPVPGYGFNSVGFQVVGNPGTVTFKNCNVYNVGSFVFAVNGNNGNIRFLSTSVAPKKGSSTPISSWRDCIHAKDNRGAMTFDGCTFTGNEDDVFNISNTMLEVVSVGSGGEYRVKGLDYGSDGSFHEIRVGDTVTVADPVSGALYGTTKVKEVIDQHGGNIRIRLAEAFSGVSAGCYFSIAEFAAPGTVIKNSTFSGTIRLRGSHMTVTNCRFEVLQMWTAFEVNCEGPLPPADITYEKCTFTRRLKLTDPVITFRCAAQSGATPQYGVKSIVFSGCTFADSTMLELPANGGVTVR